MWFLLFDDDDDDDEDDDYVTVGPFGTTCWDMFEILLIGLVYPVHDVTTCYQPTDRQSDELQELLELLFATKNILRREGREGGGLFIWQVTFSLLSSRGPGRTKKLSLIPRKYQSKWLMISSEVGETSYSTILTCSDLIVMPTLDPINNLDNC